MIETKDLLLDKGRIADWKVMYENVWKHEGTARYTMWTAAQTKEAGYEMTHNYLAFQEVNPTHTSCTKKRAKRPLDTLV